MLEAHVRSVQETAAKRKAKYVLVTDNSFFDVGWIDWLLCTYSKTATTQTQLRDWMDDRRQYGRCHTKTQVLREAGFRITLPKSIGSYVDHTPLNDATSIAHKFAFYRRWTRRKSSTK